MAERERAVARLDQLPIGEMREVRAGGAPVLLVHLEDGVRAFGARCPHSGAPLAEGLLSAWRIVCPWHHACFVAATGALPCLPSLQAKPRG